jgi:hypothetical protein
MRYQFESDFPVRGIDPENGFIRGATICTAGIEAKGHGLKTDRVLLHQLLASAESKGSIPVGLDHKSGVRGAVGAAKNFCVVGNKLVADIQFFKTHQDFPLVMDQLSELGGTMGVSASFVGESENGLARCTDLLSADICLHPAANPTGLFSRDFDALDENSDHPETDDENDDMHDEPTTDELLEHIEQLTSHIEEIESQNEELLHAVQSLLSDEGDEDEDDADDDDGADDDEEPVLEESGARSGPHVHDHRALLQSTDFESRIEELQAAGMSAKDAHIASLKEFARSQYETINL